MSEEEIRNDLEQQRLEKAAAAEMEQTANVIKKTGIFDRVDKLYGDFDALISGAGEAEVGEEGEDMGGDMGGFEPDFGGGDIPTPTEESTNKKDNLIMEQNKRVYEEKIKKYQGIYLKRLTESIKEDKNNYNLETVEEGRKKVNKKIEDITKEIDNLIK